MVNRRMAVEVDFKDERLVRRSRLHRCLISNQPHPQLLTGYKQNWCKSLLVYIGVVLSGGLLALVLFWKPAWWMLFMFDECDFDEAQKIEIMVRLWVVEAMLDLN